MNVREEIEQAIAKAMGILLDDIPPGNQWKSEATIELFGQDEADEDDDYVLEL